MAVKETTLRRDRRVSRRSAWLLARDYIEDHVQENPGCSREECRAAVEAKLQEDFGDMPEWLTLLLKALVMLLPLFFLSRK